jgi:ubiquinone/menaquinone biosynthesis C-methylase UbiE
MKMNYSTFFSRQARKPSGLYGRFFMSRVFEKGNVALNDHMYQALSVEANDHILEIGFGTGVLAREIANGLSTGMIEGVDFSEAMFKIAKKKNRKHIKKGKVKFHLGDFEKLPFARDAFDKIFSVNTIYFWKNPDATISKIAGILKPGGKLVIGYHEKSEMEGMPLNRDIFKYYSVPELEDLLRENASLTDVETISRKSQEKTCYCTAATKQRA